MTRWKYRIAANFATNPQLRSSAGTAIARSRFVHAHLSERDEERWCLHLLKKPWPRDLLDPALTIGNCADAVEAEFREMPGLTLTSAQAALLFSLDRAQCERVLGTLVAAGVLTTDGRAFARADGGRRVV